MGTVTQRVMIVENDPDVREVVFELLTARGVEAMAAMHGRHALDQLAATAEKPDLILLDLTMPVMSGYEFLAAKAVDPAISAIPVVVMSAAHDVDERIAGCAGVVKKPVRLEALLAVIDRYRSPRAA